MNPRKPWSALCLVVGGLVALSCHSSTAAVLLTASGSTPGFGLEDPNYLETDGNIGSYPFNQAYSDKGPGQSFTIGGTGSFTLDSFSFKGGGSTGGGTQNGTWGIRISSVAGTTLTPLLTVTGIASPSLNGSEWLTWTFSGADVLTLTAGTQYAVQVLATDGYYGFSGSSTDPYADGFAFNTGGSYAFGGTVATDLGFDQTFIANITAVPEPSPATVFLGGFAAVLLLRRRNKRPAVS